jgi:phenylpyruvate tautomerase PptA (4-oxalocrotonate tautomerase family)
MPLVSVELAERVYTEKQKHDMAARLTDPTRRGEQRDMRGLP